MENAENNNLSILSIQILESTEGVSDQFTGLLLLPFIFQRAPDSFLAPLLLSNLEWPLSKKIALEREQGLHFKERGFFKFRPFKQATRCYLCRNPINRFF